MVDVAQQVEPRVVASVVVGSNPIVHPTNADTTHCLHCVKNRMGR